MVGITSGYVVGSFATDWEGTWVEEYFDWHTAFASQGFIMIIIGFLFCCFDNKNIDILRSEEVEEEADKFDAMVSPRSRTHRSAEEVEKEYSFLDQIPVL